MSKVRSIVLALVFTASTVSASFAQDFGKGLIAYNASDFATALKEWKPLAEQGDAEAQLRLALMYENGKGVPQDYKEAVKWYRLAAEQGIALAQSQLGAMYDLGNGVPQDYVIAHMLYNLAVANGDETSANRRNWVAENMSASAIEKAQIMARECMNDDYKNCGW